MPPIRLDEIAVNDGGTLYRPPRHDLLRRPLLGRLLRARNLHEFDNLVTAPLHGFRDCDDYWRRASSKPLLASVAVPTLVLNPRNDPFMPAGNLPGPADVAPAVLLEQPAEGGHVGFVSGPWPGQLGWLPQRLVRFFTETGKA